MRRALLTHRGSCRAGLDPRNSWIQKKGGRGSPRAVPSLVFFDGSFRRLPLSSSLPRPRTPGAPAPISIGTVLSTRHLQTPRALHRLGLPLPSFPPSCTMSLHPSALETGEAKMYPTNSDSSPVYDAEKPEAGGHVEEGVDVIAQRGHVATDQYGELERLCRRRVSPPTTKTFG